MVFFRYQKWRAKPYNARPILSEELRNPDFEAAGYFPDTVVTIETNISYICNLVQVHGNAGEIAAMTTNNTLTPDAAQPGDLRLEKFLPYRLSVLSNRVSNAIAQAYGTRFDLTIPAWRVMAILGRFPDLSAADLVEQTAMDKVAISRAVSSLFKNDYITRSEDPSDRRRQVLNLSELGREVYERIVPLAQQYENDLMSSLTAEEREQLDSIIEKLMDRAQAWADRGLID